MKNVNPVNAILSPITDSLLLFAAPMIDPSVPVISGAVRIDNHIWGWTIGQVVTVAVATAVAVGKAVGFAGAGFSWHTSSPILSNTQTRDVRKIIKPGPIYSHKVCNSLSFCAWISYTVALLVCSSCVLRGVLLCNESNGVAIRLSVSPERVVESNIPRHHIASPSAGTIRSTSCCRAGLPF